MSAAILMLMLAIPDGPPQVGRPLDFSGVVGRFRIEADVSPKSVTVEDPLTLRVTIHGDGVTTPPTRGDLRIFPEDLDFFREDLADEDRADPAAGTWTFVWKLRPKSTDIREVPPLRLVYWSPILRRFQAATTESLPIEVRPQEAKPAETPIDETPLDPQFFDIGPDSMDAEMYEFRVWQVALVSACVLLIWGRSGRSVKPPGVGDLALAELGRGGSAALVRYLQLRFSMTTSEPTPMEIEHALRRADVPEKVRENWCAWWRQHDERRFSRSAAETAVERKQAVDLIRRTEAACSPR